ncbi:MAG TPA: CheR family methyltransferase [Myxococcaceae bacterium]|nr:CheR family methyltransferase [Myxococcaceae bacterium]
MSPKTAHHGPPSPPAPRPPPGRPAPKVLEVAPVVRAAEMRFGLKLQTGLQSLLAKAAADLVERRVAESVAEVAARVLTASDEDAVVRRMREVASIGETYFFRNPEQLRSIEAMAVEHILKPKRRRGASQTLRIWSAACSTGEEAYTLALMFRRAAPDFDIQILGTDMNDASLATARRGIYRGRSWRKTAPEELEGGLQRTAEGWEVTPEVKRMVTFATLNLVTDHYPDPDRGVTGFDLVLCRNVLIYLDEAKIPGVMRRIALSCAARSLIALTPAEYMAARYAEGFESRPHGILVQPATRRRVTAPSLAAPPRAPARPAPARPPTPVEPQALSGALTAADEFGLALEGARSAADRGDFNEAHRLAQVALNLRKDSPAPHFLLAAMWSAARETAQALREYQQVLFLDRNSVAAELGLGNALSLDGKGDAARQHFDRALRLLQGRSEEELVAELGVTVSVARRLAVDGLEAQ